MNSSHRIADSPPPPASDERAKRLDVRTRHTQPVRHLRAPQPIHFPEEAEVPEGFTHLVVRTFLFQLLRFALGDEHTTGSDQFIYWYASDPKRCLSPDVFVKLDRPQTAFGSWKTWELGGPPDLAVEIVSPNEGDGIAWDEKLARYHALGTNELVRFDPEAPEGARVRAWDRVANDLVEREVTNDTTPCQTLGLVFCVRSIKDAPVALRLADEHGELVLDARESETKRADAEASGRAEEAKARAEEATARARAEERVRALEEELRRRGG